MEIKLERDKSAQCPGWRLPSLFGATSRNTGTRHCEAGVSAKGSSIAMENTGVLSHGSVSDSS
jgi:hypothetical protein